MDAGVQLSAALALTWRECRRRSCPAWLTSLFLLLLVSASAAQSQEGNGEWGPVFELPTHPEQMAVLPSGKVLMWPWAPDRRTPPHGPLALWDPADGTSIAYPASGIESASGLAFQPDGVLLSAGGDMPRGGVDGNPRTFTFDYATESLTEVASMAAGRVFPSATTLGTGQILVTAGLDEDKEIAAIPELWDGEGWTRLPEAFNEESRGPTYQFLALDGRLFRAGPEELTDWLDVQGGSWSEVEPPARNEIRYQGIAVMYAEGKVLMAGGCSEHNCSHVPAVATAEVIDLRDPAPAWRRVSPMAFPRHSHHATLLPDGTVLITGGTGSPEIFNDEGEGILEAELWDPTTETFTTVASMDEPRHFQSAAVLLPDGRVLVAGGAFGPSDEEARFSSTGQIYSPPYLDRGPRPMIARAPSAVVYGREFTIETPDASEVSSVTLLGLSATSQGWNGSQRLINLAHVPAGDRVTGEIPSQPNLIPPGYYLLFLLNDRGVPSVGHVLRVGIE